KQFAIAGEAKPDALDLYQRTANSLRRLLESVGLQRRARDIAPSLAHFLRDGGMRAIDSQEPVGSPQTAEQAEPALSAPDALPAAPEPRESRKRSRAAACIIAAFRTYQAAAGTPAPNRRVVARYWLIWLHQLLGSDTGSAIPQVRVSRRQATACWFNR